RLNDPRLRLPHRPTIIAMTPPASATTPAGPRRRRPPVRRSAEHDQIGSPRWFPQPASSRPGVTNPDGEADALIGGYVFAPPQSFDFNGNWDGGPMPKALSFPIRRSEQSAHQRLVRDLLFSV
ncbi:MAG TPA: hypothetical protein VMS98_18010, partial [Thermoanaerobaculia bacterium]|nr:hypothetical protein [Thermoanaerobaculia bacterium]